MNPLRLILLAVTFAFAALLLTAPAMSGARERPVTVFTDPTFGRVVAAPDKQALYYWSKEPRGKITCVGGCAELWPPLIVRSRSAVPKKIRGIRGTFGVIRRPDGRLQVTHNRRAIYTYVHEGPNQVLCNDVDGWFVVRA